MSSTKKIQKLQKSFACLLYSTLFYINLFFISYTKVLKENPITDRSWCSEKLFIMQNYTDKADRDVPLVVENV